MTSLSNQIVKDWSAGKEKLAMVIFDINIRSISNGGKKKY